MEHAVIAALLEKYWSAETTVEEEKTLAAYFSQPSVAPELEPYRHLFGWYAGEAALVPGKDLESKILESIRQTEDAQSEPPALQTDATTPLSMVQSTPIRPLYRHAFQYAAAAVILIGLGIFLMVRPGETSGTGRQGTGAAPALAQTEVHTGGGSAIADTYDDPQQALAAIRKALFTASAKMNKGKKITQEHMDRLNDSWQTAVSN